MMDFRTQSEYLRWRKALALTESGNNNRAAGDANSGEVHAFGAWQMHVSFLWDWLFSTDWVPVPATSWDSVFSQALWNFFRARSSQAPDMLTLAMEFHLGVAAVRRGDWDHAYADRFSKFYKELSDYAD